jgi:fucose 4-O-acetylase-like acetyltransferase
MMGVRYTKYQWYTTLGVYFRKYDLLSKVKSSHILYFILTPIWVYMIYSGSMELAVRNYGQYGLVIIGSAAGVLSIYQLSSYISDKMPVLKEVLRMAGESSMLVLMIHTLIGSEIGTVVSCRFDSRYIPYLICTVVLQIVLSWLVKKALGAFRLTI